MVKITEVMSNYQETYIRDHRLKNSYTLDTIEDITKILTNSGEYRGTWKKRAEMLKTLIYDAMQKKNKAILYYAVSALDEVSQKNRYFKNLIKNGKYSELNELMYLKERISSDLSSGKSLDEIYKDVKEEKLKKKKHLTLKNNFNDFSNLPALRKNNAIDNSEEFSKRYMRDSGIDTLETSSSTPFEELIYSQRGSLGDSDSSNEHYHKNLRELIVHVALDSTNVSNRAKKLVRKIFGDEIEILSKYLSQGDVENASKILNNVTINMSSLNPEIATLRRYLRYNQDEKNIPVIATSHETNPDLVYEFVSGFGFTKKSDKSKSKLIHKVLNYVYNNELEVNKENDEKEDVKSKKEEINEGHRELRDYIEDVKEKNTHLENKEPQESESEFIEDDGSEDRIIKVHEDVRKELKNEDGNESKNSGFHIQNIESYVENLVAGLDTSLQPLEEKDFKNDKSLSYAKKLYLKKLMKKIVEKGGNFPERNEFERLGYSTDDYTSAYGAYILSKHLHDTKDIRAEVDKLRYILDKRFDDLNNEESSESKRGSVKTIVSTLTLLCLVGYVSMNLVPNYKDFNHGVTSDNTTNIQQSDINQKTVKAPNIVIPDDNSTISSDNSTAKNDDVANVIDVNNTGNATQELNSNICGAENSTDLDRRYIPRINKKPGMQDIKNIGSKSEKKKFKKDIPDKVQKGMIYDPSKGILFPNTNVQEYLDGDLWNIRCVDNGKEIFGKYRLSPGSRVNVPKNIVNEINADQDAYCEVRDSNGIRFSSWKDFYRVSVGKIKDTGKKITEHVYKEVKKPINKAKEKTKKFLGKIKNKTESVLPGIYYKIRSKKYETGAHKLQKNNN